MAAEASPGDAITPSRFDPYGPNAEADATRQAQQTNSNDTPTDVTINAVVVREQAGTFVLMGKNFEANADRRNKIFDLIAQRDGLAK
jgi:hypothetical protein